MSELPDIKQIVLLSSVFANNYCREQLYSLMNVGPRTGTRRTDEDLERRLRNTSSGIKPDS